MSTGLADIPRLRLQCEAIREQHREMRAAKPLIRLWANRPDGAPGLVLRGIAADNMAGQFPFRKNSFGTGGTLKLRLDHHLARWIVRVPNDATAKKNIVITVDFMGGKLRWSGLLKSWKVIRDSAGIRYLETTWIDDLQFLQFMLGPPNPLLPIPLFQFPRVLPIFGPAKWAISMLILINLIRLNGNLWTLPDDPFAVESWDDLFDWSDWQVLIKANPFDLDDSSLWTILATRMNRIDEVIADALDDAQLVMTYRRILTVDGETSDVPGVPEVANGALVLEVQDKSGYWNADGTGTGGGVAGGFIRTVQAFTAGFIEDSSVLVMDDPTVHPEEYSTPGFVGTKPGFPWVVVRDSQWTAIQSSQLVYSPPTAVGVIVGGDNPMADSLAKLAIESTAALIGYFLLGGFSALGSIAADIAMPFLQGTILAWLQWENYGRGHNLGWVHLYELYQQGAENNAWSLSAIAALRAGFLASRAETAHQFSMGIGAQHLPGLHFVIGDRIGSVDSYVDERIFVEQVEEIDPSWDWTSGKQLDIKVTVGQAKAAMSQAERSSRLLSKALTTLSNIGVHLVS
ncbi:Gp37-like protein [Nocardia thailandica]|uniref:Gp37-like protein n=1 Tax=Nocardia thailandica TaxID=257275 RepID=UPI0002D9BAE4|nr:hypothetical protein [Nocardia thailandica]